MVLEVVILTVSSKNRGHCVAGIDLENGKWIRLVSDDVSTHGALSSNDIAYLSGGRCKPLDVVKVPIKRYLPIEHQPENALIDPTLYWEKVRTTNIEGVLRIHPLEFHDALFGNTYPYVTEAGIGKVTESLILVEVSDLTISHPRERTTKAAFIYRGTQYDNISVTDPEYYFVPDNWCVSRAVLVVSLPESPYEGIYYYKFIAKIFPR